MNETIEVLNPSDCLFTEEDVNVLRSGKFPLIVKQFILSEWHSELLGDLQSVRREDSEELEQSITNVPYFSTTNSTAVPTTPKVKDPASSSSSSSSSAGQTVEEAKVKSPTTKKGIWSSAGMGKSETAWSNALFRGDRICWITPSLCKELSLNAFSKFVDRVVKSVAASKLKDALRLGLNEGDISLQLASYGAGKSYARHLDTHIRKTPAASASRNASGIHSRLYAGSGGAGTSASRSTPNPSRYCWGRKLTIIFYLNADDVQGNLRAFRPRSQMTGSTTDASDKTDDLPACVEVSPQIGTMVIFRSDIVEHEVLPCVAPRHALTMWINGDLESANDLVTAPSVPPAVAAASNVVDRTVALSANKSSVSIPSGINAVDSSVSVHPISPPASISSHFSLQQLSGAANDPAVSGGPTAAVVTPQSAKTPSSAKSMSSKSTSSSSSVSSTKSISKRPESLVVPSATAINGLDVSVPTIFVSIVAYRDSEVSHTIRDLFATAAHPNRVYVGLVFQGDFESDVERCFTVMPGTNDTPSQASPRDGANEYSTAVLAYRKGEWDWQPSTSQLSESNATARERHVRITHMHYKQATGPCYARHVCNNALFANEDYVLQIDSHMRFRENWDSYLIHMHESIRLNTSSAKPILTTYPLPYFLPSTIPNDTSPTILCPSHFDANDGILRQVAKRMVITKNQQVQGAAAAALLPIIPSAMWAAGFSFARGEVMTDVPYDNKLAHLFFGEEVSMAARLFTSGYDFFSPPEAVVYHLWSRGHRPTQSGDALAVGNVGAVEASKLKSQQVVRDLLRGVCPESGYGLGSVRPLAAFVNYLGVDFNERIIDVSKATARTPSNIERLVVNDGAFEVRIVTVGTMDDTIKSTELHDAPASEAAEGNILSTSAVASHSAATPPKPPISLINPSAIAPTTTAATASIGNEQQLDVRKKMEALAIVQQIFSVP